MKTGTLYGIGVGPGDPELLSVKAARILGTCRHVFAPSPPDRSQSTALSIVRAYLSPDVMVSRMEFPMTGDREQRRQAWLEQTEALAGLLGRGMDACYLTLGDTLLYSTYGYMVRALRTRLPGVEVRTIPGIPSFSAAAARVEFPLGHDKQPLCVIPVSGGMDLVRKGLQLGGVVVFMKIGRRLPELLDILRREGLLTESVFVARAGLEGERVETDLELLQSDPDAGRLSVVLVNTAKENRS